MAHYLVDAKDDSLIYFSLFRQILNSSPGLADKILKDLSGDFKDAVKDLLGVQIFSLTATFVS